MAPGALASGVHWPRAFGNVNLQNLDERKGIASANVSRVNQLQRLVVALTQQTKRLENKRGSWLEDDGKEVGHRQ